MGAEKKLEGIIDSYFETGCEGLEWMFFEDGKVGWDAFKMLEEGDKLTITGGDGAVLFDGLIDPDWEVGYKEYPLNPGAGQPCALGYWIHWTQRGWEPDAWAGLFIGREPKLRATLIKK